MPKQISDEKTDQWIIECDVSVALYDGATIFCDGVKVGQLIMIRGEKSRELIRRLVNTGMKTVVTVVKQPAGGTK